MFIMTVNYIFTSMIFNGFTSTMLNQSVNRAGRNSRFIVDKPRMETWSKHPSMRLTVSVIQEAYLTSFLVLVTLHRFQLIGHTWPPGSSGKVSMQTPQDHIAGKGRQALPYPRRLRQAKSNSALRSRKWPNMREHEDFSCLAVKTFFAFKRKGKKERKAAAFS